MDGEGKKVSLRAVSNKEMMLENVGGQDK